MCWEINGGIYFIFVAEKKKRRIMLYLWGKKIERNNVIFEKGKKKGKKGITNDSLSLTLIHSLSLTPYPFPPIPLPLTFPSP